LVVVLITMLMSGFGVSVAEAGPLRVRFDPNDSTSKLDIHKVITRLSPSKMYLRLSSWDRFRVNSMRETWGFDLDTTGSPLFDRWAQIYPSPHGVKCYVGEGPHGVKEIGIRHATRPDRRSAACHLPRGWFGPIHRAVRFKAFIEEPSSPSAADDAPDKGLYRWI
jgi:hypothetical protein